MRLVPAMVCGLFIASPVFAASIASGDAPRAHSPSGSAAPSPLPHFQPSIVHSHFGGQIFGFDIDQNGSEGVLTEALDTDGGVLAAVETFDQRTGAIIRIVSQTQSDADDFITRGVVGAHVGLVEVEHEVSFLHVTRSFSYMNPLAKNAFTGHWDPPIDSDHLIEAVSRNQGANVLSAVYAYDNSENFRPQVFLSNIVTNTFGPLITMTNASFQTGLVPKIAYNPTTDLAFLGIQTIGNAFIAPTFAQVDMQSGQTIIFSGAGIGDVNGLAIDPVTNRACATTEIDFSVEFYDLATRSGFAETLPGADNQFFSGADVAVDSMHGLFLVAQPNSSTDPGSSSIHVFDEQGNLVESLDGFHFSNTGNVVPMHIAVHPAGRFGFVDGPDAGVSEIQSFTY